MKLSTRSVCSSLISTPALRLAAIAIAATSTHAATLTWDGSTNTWPSVHWLDSGSVLVAGGTGAAITDTYTINSGTVNFTDHDTFGNSAANPLLTINVNGGTLSNEAAAFGQAFTTLGLVNLTGGTITSTGGANSGFQAFQLRNTVTSSGASFINTTGTPANFNGVHVTNNIFNVTDGTLTVSAPLINAAGGAAAGFTKTGAGIMTLSGVNGLTGSVVSSAGTLDVATGGALTNISVLNTKSGGAVTISGTVTIGNAGSFGVGAGAASTTGSVTLNTGGVLNVGNGGGFVAIGGKDASGSGLGNGTLTIAGGTMNVAAPGTGTSAATGLSGVAGGLDATNFWMNPYGTGGGTSTINLDGGTLATARAIARGSTSNAIFNFNGGTGQATAATAGVIFNGLTRVNIRNGGGTIDTMANNFTVAQPLLHSDVGGDNVVDGGLTKNGNGTLTLTGAAGSFTGNVSIAQGTLVAGAATGGTNPTTSPLGNPQTAGRLISVAAGATLQFTQHDVLGNAVTVPVVTVAINGGTVKSTDRLTTLGPVTLNGGTLTSDGGVNFGGTFIGGINLNGVVTVTGTAPSVMDATVSANSRFLLNNTGAKITTFAVADVTGNASADLTVSALLANPWDGGNGGVTKTGAGTMLLGAVNSYTGATTLDGGSLLVNGSTNVASAVAVAAGATLGGTGTVFGTATVASGGTVQAGQNGSGTLTLGGLSLAGNATLSFGSAANYVSNPGINITGSNALVANGAPASVLFTFSGGLSAGTTYKLVGYSGTIGGTGQSAFHVGVLPGRADGTLDYSTPGLIQLNVSGVVSLIWTGGNNSTWSTASQAPTFNWKLNSNSAGTDFLANDIVIFDDTATNKTVDISGGNVAPASVAFTNTTGNDYTLGGANGISGGAAISKSGSGKVTINSANTFTGGTTLTAGTIAIGNAAALGTGSVTVDGGTLDVSGISPTIGALGGGGIVTNSIASPATLNVNSATTSTFAGALQDGAGSLALNKQGNGTLILTGTSTHTGGTTVSTGTLQIGDGATNGSVAGTITTNATLAFNPASAQSSGATINGSGNVTKLGTNTLTLTGAATHTGLTTASNGTLVIGNGASISGSSSVSAASGILTVDAGGSIANVPSVNTKGGGTLNVNGTVTVANGGSFGVGAGATSTTGTVVVNTGGVLNIGNGGGYAGIGGRDSTGVGLGNGTLTITGGTVNVAAAGTGSSGLGGLDATNFWMNPYGTGGGTSTVNLDGGALNLSRTITNGSGSSTIFNFNGGTLRAVTTDAGVLLNGLTRANVRNGGARIDTAANNITLNQALLHSNIGGDNANDGGLTKLGTGNLTIAGAGTHTGNVTVSAGTLTNNIQANNATPTATGLGDMTTAGKTVTVASGAKIVFNASDAMGSFQYKTPVVFNVNGGTLENGAGRFMAIGDVTLSNGGRINTVNGLAANAHVLNLRGDITVNGTSGSFISTTGATLNGIHLGGTSIPATTFNVSATGDPVADLTVSAPLLDEVNVGAGALTKTGNGKMVLSAANTYTGVTNVNAGTLLVNGSISGSDVVVNGGTLGGSGSVKTAWIKAGAIFAPGASIGTFSASGGDILLEGISNFEINKTGLTLSADLAVSSSIIAYGGTLNITATGSTLVPGDTFNLFDAPDLGANVFSAINLPSLDIGYSWDTTDLGTGGTITVVPEPGSAVLLLAGLGLLARRRRG